MTDDTPFDVSDVPDVIVRKHAKLPLVWLVPVIAAAIAASLWIKAIGERGPEITIRFATGAGLVAGKTLIKAKDVELGLVRRVELLPDLSGVLVTAEMQPAFEPFQRDHTRFWVVRPRIGRGGVSGLNTLVSGAFIEIDPSRDGLVQSEFVGLEEAPLTQLHAPGLKIQLRSERRGSLDAGSLVFHRQKAVGYVERQRWGDGFDSVLFDIYIEEPYVGLIRENTRFWHTSGVSLSLGADGLEVRAESLDSLISGGVSFAVPHGHDTGTAAEAGTVFKLYDDETSAMEDYAQRDAYVLHFEESLRGLTEGAPVEFRGVRVGTVRQIEPVFDEGALDLRLPVLIDLEPERFNALGPGGQTRTLEERRANLEGFVADGLRAQLASGNLLTGQRFVNLDRHRGTAVIYRGSPDPTILEIPTIPSNTAALGETLAQLPEVVSGLRESVDAIAELLGAEQLTSTLGSVETMAADLARLTNTLDEQAPDLLTTLSEALADARTLLDALGRDVPPLLVRAEGTLETLDGVGDSAGRELTVALRDLSAALSSIRELAEYLERHPEALLHGKDAP